MRATTAIIEEALAAYPNACIAVSGGDDSLVLADIILRRLGHRLPLLYVDSRMDYPGTADFVREVAARYETTAMIAEAPHDPLTQWQRAGWAMLGKLAARKWMQRHRGREMGFRCDVTGCCRTMKIQPARRAMQHRGVALQFTGQRGNADDALRGMRAIKDGAVKWIASDRITVCNPLLGWTDLMIQRYHAEHNLIRHPAKAAGALTIGCVYCGGGAQFTNSGFKVLRRTRPDLWHWFMVDCRAGEIVLAIKYDQPLEIARTAIEKLGGLASLAETRPHLFDYLAVTPIPGYQRGIEDDAYSEDTSSNSDPVSASARPASE